jgi:hypothetical protein
MENTPYLYDTLVQVLRQEYRKIKRPFPPTARAHPVAHPALPGTTTRRASTREAAWAWQAVRKLATKSCELRP